MSVFDIHLIFDVISMDDSVLNRYCKKQMEVIRYIGKILEDGNTPLAKELLRYAMKSKSFDFLNNPQEDIYTLGDGEKI